MEALERAAMVRGRILASKSWSFESSHSANRVSILSRSSSFSSSDFPVSAEAHHAPPPEVEDSAMSVRLQVGQVLCRFLEGKVQS